MTLDKINNIVSYVPTAAGLLLFAWIFAQNMRGKLTVSALKKSVLFFALFIGAIIIAKIFLQYEINKHDPFGKLMLPPYQSWHWFVYSMWRQNIAPYLFSLIGGAFMYAAALVADTRFKRELFVEEDPYILILVALATGWPNFVMFLVLTAILTVLQSAITSALKKDFANHRVVITNALLASAILVLAFGNAAGQYLKIYLLTI